MDKGMITWRTRSMVHYIKDDKGYPLCGAKRKYNDTWYVNENDIVTCVKCKRLYKKEKTNDKS